MSGIAGILLKGAEVMRPVLIKLVPKGVLSSLKARVIEKEARQIAESSIEPFDAKKFPKGVNLIGDIRVDTGLGESMRYVSQILDAARLDNLIYNYFVPPGMNMSDHSCDEKISDKLKYGVNIFHINASEMPVAYMDLGKAFFDGHYNIGFWLWELEDFPKEWMPAFNLIDELWVPSDFEKNIFEKLTDKPVLTVPYPVADKVGDRKADRKRRNDFSLPEDKFLFLMMYDGGSGAARKNPDKVIESFKKAFAPNDDRVGLVVKLKQDSRDDMEHIRALAGEYKNVYFIDKNMTRDEVYALIGCVDAYVSLHRAEGFGLICAEAMALGTPVIATAWSATTDFMNEECACMVDYELTELDRDYPPFKKGYRWAEADSSSAASYMRKLFEDREFYDIMRSNACRYVRERLSMQRASDIAGKRLRRIME
jgi:glycosyltransferase involved in cell wall biosynthesis